MGRLPAAHGRTRVRRSPHRAAYDTASIQEALSRAFVAHVALVDDGQPYCIPMLYGYDETHLYVHASSASRIARQLASGIPSCTTITVLEGLVLARSAYEHSANYVSVVALGSYEAITGVGEKLRALELLTERLVPGRWSEVRHPSDLELRATSILRLPLGEVSVKRRTGGPDDDDTADAALDAWAGVVPIGIRFAPPVASEGLRTGIGLPVSVERLLASTGPP